MRLDQWLLPLLAPDDGTGTDDGGDGGGDGKAKGPTAPGEEFDFAKYRESIKDPNIKAYSERFKGFDEVLTTHQQQRQELSDRIRLPSEKATAEEMTRFRKAMGVPETAAEYEIKLPDGMKLSDDDKTIIEAWRPIAHAHNVPAKAFNQMIAESLKLSQGLEAKFEERLKAAQAEGEAALRKEWSVDYDKNLALAKRAAVSLGGEEFWTFLDATLTEGGGKLAAHPAILKFLANIGRKSDESDLMLVSSATERQTAQQELDALYTKHPVGSPEYKTPAVQKRIAELFETIHGKKPIVGTEGRAA